MMTGRCDTQQTYLATLLLFITGAFILSFRQSYISQVHHIFTVLDRNPFLFFQRAYPI